MKWVLGLLGLGALFWWVSRRNNTLPAASTTKAYLPGGSTNPFYTGSDLGPFAPITTLPGVGQLYQTLRPINDKIIQPFVNEINNSKPIRAVNNAIGGPPTITRNPDGTITRTVPNTWWSSNVGKPVSAAATGVVHEVSSCFGFC
jgi:hypothetical protein